MAGHATTDLDRPTVMAVVDQPLERRPDGKMHFARVTCRYDDATATLPACAPPAARAPTSWRPWRPPTRWPSCPTGPTLAIGATVRVRLLRP